MQDLNSSNVRSQMALPPDMQEPYKKIIQAGLKIMFDPTTRGETIKFMAGPGDMGDKIGVGVASVILMLFKESNQTMPPQLMIPAGTELVVHACDVSAEAGKPIDKADMAQAMGTMIEMIFEKLGIDPAQLQSASSGIKPQGMGA